MRETVEQLQQERLRASQTWRGVRTTHVVVIVSLSVAFSGERKMKLSSFLVVSRLAIFLKVPPCICFISVAFIFPVLFSFSINNQIVGSTTSRRFARFFVHYLLSPG